VLTPTSNATCTTPVPAMPTTWPTPPRRHLRRQRQPPRRPRLPSPPPPATHSYRQPNLSGSIPQCCGGPVLSTRITPVSRLHPYRRGLDVATIVVVVAGAVSVALVTWTETAAANERHAVPAPAGRPDHTAAARAAAARSRFFGDARFGQPRELTAGESPQTVAQHFLRVTRPGYQARLTGRDDDGRRADYLITRREGDLVNLRYLGLDAEQIQADHPDAVFLTGTWAVPATHWTYYPPEPA